MTGENHHNEEFEILVNNQAVKVLGDHPTGHHIKTSSIEQGVLIDESFQLVVEAPGGDRPVEDSEHVTLHAGVKFKAHPHPVIIKVNEKEVSVPGHHVSGLQIKEAAISQGLSIQLDFILSLEFEPRKSKVIGDDEIVEVHKHSLFIAVAPDDNSQGGL
jgi:hypothetical protein